MIHIIILDGVIDRSEHHPTEAEPCLVGLEALVSVGQMCR